MPAMTIVRPIVGKGIRVIQNRVVNPRRRITKEEYVRLVENADEDFKDFLFCA